MNDESFATSWKQVIRPPTGAGRLRQAVRNTALSAASRMMPFKEDKYLRLLYCHYVFDDQKEHFEQIIVALQRIGTFVDTDTCIAMLDARKQIDNRYFHLSFDDGFRNIVSNAGPILRQYSVPAILFVPTSLVSASFAVAKRYCVKTTRYNAVIEMVCWEELAELVSLGFDVGSHTRTHARLSDISYAPNLIQDEIMGSKHDIEARLGVNCRYISWPYGTLGDIDAACLEMVEKADYAACFGAFRGQVLPGKTHRFRIPRHHFEAQWPLSHVTFFAQGGMEKNQ